MPAIRSLLSTVRPLVWTVLFLAPQTLTAQNATLGGRVTDAGGTPLVGANLIVPGTVLGSATDREGRYMITRIPAGNQAIICSMIGYEKKRIPIVLEAGEHATLDIVLQETTVTTGEVIVTAGKHAQSFDEIPVSISTMSGPEIESRGIETLEDALRTISGVNIAEDQVNIRGSSGYSRALGSRVLLLVDGASVLAGDAGDIKFDVVPMFAVERIEVVKGAGSALYGSSALGGVINVITREPQSRMTRVRLSSGIWDDPYHEEWKWWGDSPRRMHSIDLQHGDAHGPFSYLVSAGFHSDQAFRQNNDFVRWNVNGRGWLRISAERNLAVSFNTSSNDRGNWVYWRDLGHALQPPLEADLSERIVSDKTQASVLYRQIHGANFASSLRLNVYRTHFETSSDTSDFSMRPSDRTQSTAWLAGLEWQGMATLSTRNLLTAGVDANYTTIDSRTYGARSGWSIALYAQDEIALNAVWHLSAGTRFDLTAVDTLQTDMQVNPRLGMTFQPWMLGVLRAAYGWGFRSPSIAERFATASAGGIITKPNPDLQAERSVSYELGFKQLLPFELSFDAAAFWSEYDNLVEPMMDPADRRIMFRNITQARIQGYELTLEGRPMGDLLHFSASYTYLYPRDMITGSVLKYRPRHLLYLSGDLFYAGFSLGADFRHLSRIENIDRELTIVIPGSEERVATYVTDLRASWTAVSIGLPLRLAFYVDNVFQYNYSEVVANVAPIRSYRLALEAAF